MTSKINTAERDRANKLDSLLRDRAKQFPNESYDARFAAVANSEDGKKLFTQMHVANEDALPVQSPRHAALLGRTWPIPDAEFRRLWLAKFGPIGPGSPNSPSYPSEEDEQRRTAKAAGKITDEVKLKEEGKRGFLDEVARLMAAGHEYSQAWSIAAATSPGKELYAQWARGAAQLKSGA